MPSSPMLLLSATLSNLQSAIFLRGGLRPLKFWAKRYGTEPKSSRGTRATRSREPRYHAFLGAASRGTSDYPEPRAAVRPNLRCRSRADGAVC